LDATLQQLTIYDVLAELEREPADEPIGMSRLGAGPELGMTLLQPLLMRGWTLLPPVVAFAGGRQLFILVHKRIGLEVKAEGATLGDVAVELFEQAAAFTPWSR
jgi:hypothetical protein